PPNDRRNEFRSGLKDYIRGGGRPSDGHSISRSRKNGRSWRRCGGRKDLRAIEKIAASEDFPRAEASDGRIAADSVGGIAETGKIRLNPMDAVVGAPDFIGTGRARTRGRHATGGQPEIAIVGTYMVQFVIEIVVNTVGDYLLPDGVVEVIAG